MSRNLSFLSSGSSLASLSSTPISTKASSDSQVDSPNESEHSNASLSSHTLLRESRREEHFDLDSSQVDDDIRSPSISVNEEACRGLSSEESFLYSHSHNNASICDSTPDAFLTGTQVLVGLSANSAALSAAAANQGVDVNSINRIRQSLSKAVNGLLSVWEHSDVSPDDADSDQLPPIQDQANMLSPRHHLTASEIDKQQLFEKWVATQIPRSAHAIDEATASRLLELELKMLYELHLLFKQLDYLQDDNDCLRNDIRVLTQEAMTTQRKLKEYQSDDKAELRRLQEKIMILEEELDARPEQPQPSANQEHTGSIFWPSTAKPPTDSECEERNALTGQIRHLEQTIDDYTFRIRELEQALVESRETVESQKKELLLKNNDLEIKHRSIKQLEDEVTARIDDITRLNKINDEERRNKEELLVEIENLKSRPTTTRSYVEPLETAQAAPSRGIETDSKNHSLLAIALHIPPPFTSISALTTMPSVSFDGVSNDWSWAAESNICIIGAAKKFIGVQHTCLYLHPICPAKHKISRLAPIGVDGTSRAIVHDVHRVINVVIPKRYCPMSWRWEPLFMLASTPSKQLHIPSKTIEVKKLKVCTMGLMSIKSTPRKSHKGQACHTRSKSSHNSTGSLKRQIETFHLSILQNPNKTGKFSYLPVVAVEILQSTQTQLLPINEYSSREISCVSTHHRQQNTIVRPCGQMQFIKMTHALSNSRLKNLPG